VELNSEVDKIQIFPYKNNNNNLKPGTNGQQKELHQDTPCKSVTSHQTSLTKSTTVMVIITL